MPFFFIDSASEIVAMLNIETSMTAKIILGLFFMLLFSFSWRQMVSRITLFQIFGEKGRELVPRNEVYPVV